MTTLEAPRQERASEMLVMRAFKGVSVALGYYQDVERVLEVSVDVERRSDIFRGCLGVRVRAKLRAGVRIIHTVCAYLDAVGRVEPGTDAWGGTESPAGDVARAAFLADVERLASSTFDAKEKT